jgi:hypothetical protein
MKNLPALSAAALTITFAVPVLPQATQAQSSSAATACRGMSESKRPALVLASTADRMTPSSADTGIKVREVVTPHPVSPDMPAYQLGLQGGGG